MVDLRGEDDFFEYNDYDFEKAGICVNDDLKDYSIKNYLGSDFLSYFFSNYF